MTGPPPKPTKLRMLQGNASRRPINTNEPQPEVAPAAVEPPVELEGDAKRIWDMMVPILSKIGLLTVCDLRVFARYCDLCVRWWETKQFLDANGETYAIYEPLKKYNKTAKKWESDEMQAKWANYPQVKNYLSYAKELIRIEQEMGLTPASRSRIQVEIWGKDKTDDAMAAYLASNQRKPIAA